MGVWGCHRGRAEVGRADGGWANGDGLIGDGPRWLEPMGNGPTGAITGTRHYCMTSRMPSSAREEGFQIFMYFVHYNHFLRLQID